MSAAGVAELADALDLGSSAARRGGSTPFTRTINFIYCQNKKMAGVLGFEPRRDGIKIRCLTAWLYPNHFIKMVEGDGFEPPNPKERIYSPPRLATSLPLHGMVPAKGVEPSTY